jgi:hypothetical protein
MSLIDALTKNLKKDEDFKAAQKARRIQKILSEREKSSNERVLEKFNEEKRQEMIKKDIDEINKIRNDEMFNKSLTPQKNIFIGGNDILRGGNSILKSDKSVLLGGNMFFK